MSDVAKAAGVSRLTVSRVVNNHAGITSETAGRIRQVMSDLGYNPGPVDSRRGPKPKNPERSRTVVFVAAGIYDSVLRSDVYHDLSLAVEKALDEQGYSMITRRLSPDMRVRGSFTNVDGVILLGDSSMVRESINVPCVHVMRRVAEGEPWDHVTYDGYQIGVVAAKHFLLSGHRDTAILCAGSEPETPRRAGFLDTMKKAGCSPMVLDGEMLYRTNETAHVIDTEALCNRLGAYLSAPSRPTSIFVEADLVTAALYPLLYEKGIIPGRDVSILSCNNEVSILSGLNPRPPSVDLHLKKIGQAAVEQLLYRLDHITEPLVTMVFKPEVCIPTLGKNSSTAFQEDRAILA